MCIIMKLADLSLAINHKYGSLLANVLKGKIA